MLSLLYKCEGCGKTKRVAAATAKEMDWLAPEGWSIVAHSISAEGPYQPYSFACDSCVVSIKAQKIDGRR
jgi:hypothetical protein